jgi:hypothetical protein
MNIDMFDTRCIICDKKAFVYTYEGEKYCAHCTTKEFKDE